MSIFARMSRSELIHGRIAMTVLMLFIMSKSLF